jgi:type III secretion protein L
MGRIIRADRNSPKRITADRFDATIDARQLVEQARQRANQLYEEAERDIQNLKDRAREQGRQQGKAEVAGLLIRASKERERMLAAAEKQIVELALLAARRIIQKELYTSPETIVAVVSPLIKRAQRSQNITIRVHPQDLPALETALPELSAEAELVCSVQVEPDETIERGGCVVTTDIGTFDARIEVQLDALARALQKEGIG